MDKENELSWIVGLMRANSEALGFIPETTLRERYIAQEQYVLQTDERGNRVGYLLHGRPRPGGILVVTQHCIDMDHRLHGYGEKALDIVLERARGANCRAIKLRCAANLPSNEFWKAVGFEQTTTQHPVTRRRRDIHVYVMDLWPTLFSGRDVEVVQPQDCGFTMAGNFILPARGIAAKEKTMGICGIISNSGPNGEPLACGYTEGHEGNHSWATLPTFPQNGVKRLIDAARVVSTNSHSNRTYYVELRQAIREYDERR